MTHLEISLENLKYNCDNIKKKFPGYKYYMGVVKSNAYGLGNEAIKVIASIMDYLVVTDVYEARKIRELGINLPILVLEPINPSEIEDYVKYNLTATVDNEQDAMAIKDYKIKVHIKINTGMNRFGLNSKAEFNKVYNELRKSNAIVEGVYTHNYFVDNKEVTHNQIKLFKNILSDVDTTEIPIIHVYQSQSLVELEFDSFMNGCRVGDLMYGICAKDSLGFKSTMTLFTNVISLRHLTKNETVGYDASYKCERDEYIATIPVGYYGGITKNQIGKLLVYINDKPYKVVANAMNYSFIKVDETVKKGDTVLIYKDIKHMMNISEQTNTVPQEIMEHINTEKIYK